MTVKNVTMELTADMPLIIHRDADIDKAIRSCDGFEIRKKLRTDMCSRANRFYVHEDVLDEFTEKFTAQVKELKSATVWKMVSKSVL